MNKARLFHYTTASRFRKIAKSLVIKPTTAYLKDDERPAVWFSFSEDFEPTAIPGWKEGGVVRTITFEELVERDTPVRIEVDPLCAPMKWREWRKLSGVTRRVADALEAVAFRDHSNVTDWRMTFSPVTINKWIAIEFFVNGQWCDADSDGKVAPTQS